MAKRGYSVTGIDLSNSQLKRAREKAGEADVHIDFIQGDARRINYKGTFDLIIMLCEGGFPLMETDEMNFQILKNAERALMEGGKFIFTTLSALYPLYHSLKDFINSHSEDPRTEDSQIDLMTFREYSTVTMVDDSGNQKTLKCNERCYTPSEITWLLKSLNFEKIDIYGCPLGEFNRDRPLTTDDFEMLVIAEK